MNPGLQARAGNRKPSRGAVLLVLAGVLGIIAVIFVLAMGGASSRRIESRDRSTEALARAKEALLSFATSYGDTHSGETPGYMPCPDRFGGNPEGTAEPSCGGADEAVIGRLPWRTLDLPDLRDGSGECLWYVVSGNYKNSPKTSLLNWDTNGLLTVNGSSGEILAQGNAPTGAVAVLIAPGAAWGSQNRTADPGAPICRGNYSPAQYLDSAGGYNNAVINAAANGVSDFVTGPASDTFNDQLVWITSEELWAAIDRRPHKSPANPTGPAVSLTQALSDLAKKTAECIAAYAPLNADYGSDDDRRLLWATDYPFANGDYGSNANYDDQSGRYFGHVSRTVDTSKTATANTMSGTDLFGLCTGAAPYAPWWRNWRDHLFYAVSDEFAPSGDDDNTDCDPDSSDPCLRIDGSPRIHAAIVFFAGRRLSGQGRANNSGSGLSAAKGSISNYLEGRNATESLEGLGQDRNFETTAPSATFNDVLYCIDDGLAVSLCP